MNIYQKLAYKTAKAICLTTEDKRINNKKNLIITYKARLKMAKERNVSVAQMKRDLKFHNCFRMFRWKWSNELNHALWINIKTGKIATQKELDDYWK